jgi:lysozyme
MIELVDLSAFQSPSAVDYAALATSVQAVIVKATDGLGSPDPAFTAHVSKCQAAGIEAGAYHFLRARHGRPQDATAQGNEFCDRYLAANCTLLPALDVEDPPQTPQAQWATPEEYAEAIHDFLAVVSSRLACAPLVYSYPYFWRQLGTAVQTPEVAACPVWWADYSSANPIAPAPWNAAPLIQQYTDAGRVSGYGATIDRSRSSVTVAQLRRVQLPSPPLAAA